MKTTSNFKRTTVFATVILLVLLMAISVVPFSASAADVASEPVYNEVIKDGDGLGEKLSAINISQSGSIKMLFYFTELDGFDADDYIEIKVPQKNGSIKVTKTAFDKVTTDAKGRKQVEVTVAAAQMTDLISLQWVKVDGATETRGWTYKYSVKYYADKVLELAASNTDYAKMAQNVISMLNYGSMAQVKFGYNADNLANAKLFADSNDPNVK